MTTTKELLEKVLQDLKQLGGVEASAIVSRDGLVIAADIPPGIKPETFSAMSATALGAAETAMAELKQGVPDRVIIEASEGKIITVGAGPKALLVVMVAKDTGLGLVLAGIESGVEKIKKLLK